MARVRRIAVLLAIGSVGCSTERGDQTAVPRDAGASDTRAADGPVEATKPVDASAHVDAPAHDARALPRIDAASRDASAAVDASSQEAAPPEASAPEPKPTGDVAPPLGFAWRVVPELSDEFEGTALDATKWIPNHPYWQGRAPSQFDPANVFVGSGELGLVSTSMVDSLSTVANPDQDIWVKAACVSSKASVASYGYYEVRMKASDLSMTSSFWFQGTYSEIDVVEELGRPLVNPADNLLMQMNTHYFPGGWPNDVATPLKWTMPTGAADAYHVYGVWWRDQSSLWFFHDGQKVAEATPAGAFAEPMYLFLDSEVFTWYGLPTIASLKDATLRTMHVDWVRAWNLVPIHDG